MVYIAFRRGNWLQQLVRVIGLGCLVRSALLRRAMRLVTCGESWMVCALVFPVKCKGRGRCKVCGKGAAPLAGYHTCTIGPDPVEDVMTTTADGGVSNDDAWVYISLPKVPEAAAHAMFATTMERRMGYNRSGFLLNFVPRCIACWRGPFGMQRHDRLDDEDVKEVFCSEMMTAFLQANGYPLLDLVPCTTTPQRLHAALLDTYPELQQDVLDPRKPRNLSLSNRLMRMP